MSRLGDLSSSDKKQLFMHIQKNKYDCESVSKFLYC